MTEFQATTNHISYEVDRSIQLAFNYDNCKRNELLMQNEKTKNMYKVQKTGTTIVGVEYKDGIVLGADTRATGGSIVMDKNCEKIHYMAPNIYCCGAGTAADTENATAMIASQLQLLRLNTGSESRVVTAMTLLKHMLFRYQGHISAALVLGGVDVTGPHLYTIYPHGSTDKLPYVTMGSGSLAAMAVFEHGYKENMTEDEAKLLVENAISAGIFNDLGSGSNVDLTVIKKRDDGKVVVVRERNYRKPNEVSDYRDKVDRSIVQNIPRGATNVLSNNFEPLMSKLVIEDAVSDAEMTEDM